MVGDDAHAHVVVVVGAVASRRESAAARSSTGRTWSISYMLSTPCLMNATRSRPMPVSMFFFGSSPTMRKSVLRRHVVDQVLHEDEVPDLDVAVVVGGRAAVDAVRGAAVEEDLRARAGRAGLAGAPVVRVLAEPLDALLGQARDLLPELDGLVVVLVDGDPEVLRVEAEPAVGLGAWSAAPRRR